MIAWVSDGQDSGGKGVFARLYNAGGAPQTGEILVNTTTANDQIEPAVAMDGAGNFVVVWSGNGTGDDSGVFAQRFSSAGAKLGAEFRVNGAVVSSTQSNPDIAMETDGDFAVVWQSDETSKKEIWLQRYQANGTTIGGATLVSVLDGEDDIDPSIATDDDGDLVVAWQSKDSDGGGIFARRYNNAGVAQDVSRRGEPTTSADQLRPDVAMDADGDYVVVWDGNGASDSKGVYGRRFNAAGTAQGELPDQCPVSISNDQDHAAVSMSGDGRFVVTWDSKGQDDGGSQGIYRQEYTAAGALDGGELLVNTTTNNDQTRSAVAMDDSGSYVVAWDGEGSGDSKGVFWRRFAVAASGTITGTVYHDIDGDGNLAGASTFAGAVVRLFRDLGAGAIDPADTLVQTSDDRRRGCLRLQRGAARHLLRSGRLADPRRRERLGRADLRQRRLGARRGLHRRPRRALRRARRDRFRQRDRPQPGRLRACDEGDPCRRRCRQRRLRLQLQRGDERARQRRRRGQPGPLGPRLVPPVHPERERHGRRPGLELLDRRRRAADDHGRRGLPASRSPTRSCSTRALRKGSRVPRSSS